MLWYRLRNDYPLALITLIGAVATLGIVPFAIYRFATGNLVAGVIDSVLVLGIVGAVAHAWHTGNPRAASWFTCILTTLGCTAIAMLFGVSGLFWMYAVVSANFLLLRPREALLLTVPGLAALALHGGAFASLVQMASFLVSIAAVALFAYIFAARSEQQRDRLQLLASRDALTGVGNRHSMEEELSRAVEMARRERRPCGLAILDLDHFKRINDRYGHAAGDRALVDFVGLVVGATRKVDRLFRYGGEEFVLLLPAADSVALRTILDKLRVRIGEALQSRGEVITVSIGAAALHADEHWEAWLARADAALYQAKHDGRNRSVIADGTGHGAAHHPRDRTGRVALQTGEESSE